MGDSCRGGEDSAVLVEECFLDDEVCAAEEEEFFANNRAGET